MIRDKKSVGNINPLGNKLNLTQFLSPKNIIFGGWQ